MNLLRTRLAAAALLLAVAWPAQAQIPGGQQIVVDQTPIQNGTTGRCLYDNLGKVGEQACGGAGSVTSVSVTTANGVSGSVATATTTPAITLTLGAITPTSVNGLTISTTTGTITLANGKVLTVSNTLTFAGTDGSTLNIGAGGTLGSNAFTSTGYLPLAGGTLTGNLLFTDNTLDIGASGATRPRTGYFGTSLISPLVNGLTITNNGTNTLTIAAGKVATHNASTTFAGTDGKTLTISNSGTLAGGDAFVLAIAAAKTLTVSNTLTFTGTDASSVAFGTGGTATFTSNNLSVFAATTSAQLAGVISDETGTAGKLVFDTAPIFQTSIGLGVTPAAWSGYVPLQISNAAFAGYGTTAGVFNNLYFDGANFKYLATEAASVALFSAGTMQVYTAASGTAGNTATVAAAFQVKNAGGVTVGATIGTSNPGELILNRATASASAPGAGAGGKLAVVCGTNAGTAKIVAYAGTSTTAVTVVDNIGSGVTGC